MWITIHCDQRGKKRYQQLVPYPTEAKGNILDVFLNISFQKLSHLSTAVTLSLENFVHFAVLPDLCHTGAETATLSLALRRTCYKTAIVKPPTVLERYLDRHEEKNLLNQQLIHVASTHPATGTK